MVDQVSEHGEDASVGVLGVEQVEPLDDRSHGGVLSRHRRRPRRWQLLAV